MNQLFMLSSRISPSFSSPRIGEEKRGRGEEWLVPTRTATTPKPNSCPRRGIRGLYIKILLLILFAVFFLIPALHAGAFSQCQSEKKGYCVRLDPPETPKPAQKKFSSLLFATSHGPPFPGLEFLDTYGIGYNSKIGTTLSALYNFGIAIAGISALIMFTYGGIRYIASAGNSSATSDAKKRMSSALFGLALIAGSYLILYTINHDFTLTLSDKTIPSIKGLMPQTAPPPIGPPPVDPEL